MKTKPYIYTFLSCFQVLRGRHFRPNRTANEFWCNANTEFCWVLNGRRLAEAIHAEERQLRQTRKKMKIRRSHTESYHIKLKSTKLHHVYISSFQKSLKRRKVVQNTSSLQSTPINYSCRFSMKQMSQRRQIHHFTFAEATSLIADRDLLFSISRCGMFCWKRGCRECVITGRQLHVLG